MLARKRVPTRSSNAMVNLLSRVVVGCDLPAAAEEDAIEGNEKHDGQDSTEAVPSVAEGSIGSEVRATDAVGVPDGTDEEAEDEVEDCEDDNEDEDEGEHRIFSLKRLLCSLERPGAKGDAEIIGFGMERFPQWLKPH
jgi:hypothetical protein